MKKLFLLTMIFYSLFMISCVKDEDMYNTSNSGITFSLKSDEYAGESRVSSRGGDLYDRVEYYIADAYGNIVRNIKSKYNPSTSEIFVEGLHEGNYKLLVLGIKGDETQDKAVINPLSHTGDVWISFPENLNKPLDAEYYHSATPFEVNIVHTAEGAKEVASLQEPVVQKRIIGRMDVSFLYNNPYVRTSVYSEKLRLQEPRFYTKLSGDGDYSGSSNGEMIELDVLSKPYYYFMPSVTPLSGEITMQSRTYQGRNIEQNYGFSGRVIKPNHINSVDVDVVHPDDNSGVMFVTRMAYSEVPDKRILQDDERKEVYTDENQRKFNTSRPLQISITEDGKLNARFYSPKGLSNVMIKAKIPSISEELIDFAYFDTIPPFADFYEDVPVLNRSMMYRTESGRQVEVEKMDVADFSDAEFIIQCDNEYWKKIEKIKHGWNICWGLYGGDPDKEDGGPDGNWMGIRPVHCRESVAMFINFTYMIDLEEHEQILRDNEDKLYGNGGVEDKVTADKVLSQMRQERKLVVGLIYTGHGIAGLGGGTTFGAAQYAWLDHYHSSYSCSIMFHELGHVMGYSHSSAFTYGPWANGLMNMFYVENISKFPVESPHYLNSRENPNLYK